MIIKLLCVFSIKMQMLFCLTARGCFVLGDLQKPIHHRIQLPKNIDSSENIFVKGHGTICQSKLSFAVL